MILAIQILAGWTVLSILAGLAFCRIFTINRPD